MQNPNHQVKSYVLIITGPSTTRERILPAIRSHLSPHPSKDPDAHPRGICKPGPDFGGLLNPLAEVHMTSTLEERDKSIAWMRDYAKRHRLVLGISIREYQPELLAEQVHADRLDSV